MAKPYNPSLYMDRLGLKAELESVGLTHRDVSRLLNEPPSTTSGRLNGYSPLYPHQEEKIREAIESKKVLPEWEGKKEEGK